jgi:hypothetical protein
VRRAGWFVGIQFDWQPAPVNEVYNGQNVGGYPAGACDWAGYDFDIGMSGGLGQYLYSHHNGGPGFLMLMGDGAAEAQVIPLRA